MVAALNPVLRGWASYFRLTEVRGVSQDVDGWTRRKLRCLIWRQWKCPATRNRKLQAHGLDPTRARKSASNGRGPWWNAGASHMGAAYPRATSTHQGCSRGWTSSGASVCSVNRRMRNRPSMYVRGRRGQPRPLLDSIRFSSTAASARAAAGCRPVFLGSGRAAAVPSDPRHTISDRRPTCRSA